MPNEVVGNVNANQNLNPEWEISSSVQGQLQGGRSAPPFAESWALVLIHKIFQIHSTISYSLMASIKVLIKFYYISIFQGITIHYLLALLFMD